ncbi:TPA: HAD-IA family hydrolase [Serratia marcescens]
MECKGFLFDLDGTLVDSLPAVERAWTHWAERRGVDPQAVLDFIHGKQAITSLRHFMPGESEAEIQREFQLLEQVEAQDTDGVRALPGAIALLERLGLAPHECVVVEDAPAGILSGLAAGCQVIAVNAPADAPKLEQVDLRLDSLAQIAVDKTAQGAIVRRLA